MKQILILIFYKIMMPIELWCDICPRFKLSKYEASTLGQIRNKETQVVLKPTKNKKYLYVSITNDIGQHKTHAIHRLVAYTFITNPENKTTVNHKNHDTLDNSIHNLEWATMSEQNKHRRVCKYTENRIVQTTISGQIVNIWQKLSDLELVFPNVKQYINNELQHECYKFYYEHQFIYTNEIFKPLYVDDRLIQVSNLGRIYLYNNFGITYGYLNGGYMLRNINRKNYRVHRLVAIAFVEIPPHLKHLPYEQLVVNHKNGNKTNNVASNLEWCTQSENMYHSTHVIHTEYLKPVIKYDLQGNEIARYASISEACRLLNIQDTGHISQCCKKSRNTAYGFIWRYLEDPLVTLPVDKKLRPVLQYNTNEQLISEFFSIKEASRITGICKGNISSCCVGRRLTAGGFIWKYKV